MEKNGKKRNEGREEGDKRGRERGREKRREGKRGKGHPQFLRCGCAPAFDHVTLLLYFIAV